MVTPDGQTVCGYGIPAAHEVGLDADVFHEPKDFGGQVAGEIFIDAANRCSATEQWTTQLVTSAWAASLPGVAGRSP